MSKVIFRWILVILSLSCLSEAASACTCAYQPSPCATFNATPVVFVGKVASIKEDKTEIVRFGMKEEVRTGLLAHLIVEEALKGITRKEVDVVTGGGGGDCGYHFEEGERYLIYAYPNRTGDGEDRNRMSSTHIAGSGVTVVPGSLTTSICTRTSPLKGAQNDLEVIRAILNNKPETRIFGAVSDWAEVFCKSGTCFPRYAGPLAGLTVRAQSPQGNHEAKTDESGQYKFVNLPPGKYRVQLIMPEHYENRYEFNRSGIEVAVTSGCFGGDLTLFCVTGAASAV
jgi:hypothetical protein